MHLDISGTLFYFGDDLQPPINALSQALLGARCTRLLRISLTGDVMVGASRGTDAVVSRRGSALMDDPALMPVRMGSACPSSSP